MTIGTPLSTAPAIRKDVGRLPKNEKAEYQEMFRYYESLGNKRNIDKVAQQFNKSRSFIALVSRAFNWRDRINVIESQPIDPVVAETKDRVDDSRRKIVDVVHEIVDTLDELRKLSVQMRSASTTEEIEALDIKIGLLHKALWIWGFDWKKTKDLQTLITTLKEVATFNKDMSKPAAVPGHTTVNVDKLLIRDD